MDYEYRQRYHKKCKGTGGAGIPTFSDWTYPARGLIRMRRRSAGTQAGTANSRGARAGDAAAS